MKGPPVCCKVREQWWMLRGPVGNTENTRIKVRRLRADDTLQSSRTARRLWAAGNSEITWMTKVPSNGKQYIRCRQKHQSTAAMRTSTQRPREAQTNKVCLFRNWNNNSGISIISLHKRSDGKWMFAWQNRNNLLFFYHQLSRRQVNISKIFTDSVFVSS